MLSSITRFLRDEEGATAIEYGIIAGLISVAMITAIIGNDGIGAKITAIWGDIKTSLSSV
ncbi:Flp family type IVb pilin [Acidovorax cavernicola]|uniref:Flp family type IVb pilin n=1 Tax=Acidovorax cavernicola TaxID=1675792 RepID=A0A9X8D7Y3_9BURK|nr:Flp family type IVb pilin [Acidovorax cavernicola]RIX84000.1 Flp family type IVb pilin [Acidovorax cavernicola]